MSVQMTTNNHVLYGSLLVGEDLMDGILRICKSNQIHSGMVTCIGSLDKTGFTVFKVNQHNRPDGYAPATTIEEPVELIQATGFICKDEQGELDMHLHGIVERMDGRIQAGHFLRGYNKVCITVEFTVISSPEVTAVRAYDERLTYKTIRFDAAPL
ncbi:PPC domain-containing DNA-binding protein [Shouchella sp. JSM 1781072]|uniref:PPC domain-containing DNA-binding protein n=1 Tax=Bacillaceae TaxID=186817 RepID=UPI000C081EC0|nr:PPC domain-containing DNA-binding protein [Bacillus sp. Marseille-P3800]